MLLNEIKSTKANRPGKRVGRGVGSGMDKTSGKGHKGAKARSGPGMYKGFEGGQMPLLRRLPKRGFNNKAFAVEYREINVSALSKIAEDKITPDILKKYGMIKKSDKIKLLGNGNAPEGKVVSVHRASASAVEKMEKAGGKVIIIK